MLSRIRLFSILSLVASSVARSQSVDTTRYTILLANRPAGIQKAWTEADGTRGFYMEYNDRGRGPAIIERVKLDTNGYPRIVEIDGHDYLKAPVQERFVVEQTGLARWKSAAESSSVKLDGPAFYLGMNDASVGLMEPLLLASPEHRVRLLPQGEVRTERIRTITVTGDAGPKEVTLYADYGFGFAPTTRWADERGAFFANASTWGTIIRSGYESTIPALLGAQATFDSARGLELAKRLTRVPGHAIVFINANVFDAQAAVIRPHTTVVVTGNRITGVGADGRLRLPADAEVVNVGGRTLLPGLWDMHVHAYADDGLQDLAAGVTTVRDMGNDFDESLIRRRRWASGELIGPRLLLAGFMDGPGPFAGPTKALVSTRDDARVWVNRYADAGYAQIKVYSSLDTSLVPFIAAEAHRRGLRLSGHVPNGMTAEEFVRAGADEIQHVNFLFLNFWRDSVTDTRTPERFTVPGARAALLDLGSERVQAFVRFLRERHTAIDPTVVTFEPMFVGRPGKMDPGAAEVADRLPPTVRRYLSAGGGLPVPDSLDQRYRDSFVAFQKMVKAMYDGGVTIVAGTDGLSGFGLHRELELYAAAGIPAADVLRIATLSAARVMHRDQEVGSLEPGKLADLIIVDGHPEERISDIRRVTYVMKDGKVYDPAALYQAAGVRPVLP